MFRSYCKKVALLAMLALPAMPASAMTVEQILLEVRDKSNDNPLVAGSTCTADTGRRRFSDDRLLRKLNIAQDSVVRRSRCLKQTSYVTTTASVSTYTLPVDCWQIDRVGYWQSTGVFPALAAVTMGGADNENPRWEQYAAGLPRQYIVYGNIVYLIPKPSSSYAGTEKLRIDYLVQCATLTAATDVPFNGYPALYNYHEILVYYVAMLCKEDQLRYEEAAYLRNEYIRQLGVMIKELQSRSDWNPDFPISPQ